MSKSKKETANKFDENRVAVFHSHPFKDTQMLETAVMSIISNKYDIDRVLILLDGEDPVTGAMLEEIARTYSLKTQQCKSRRDVLSKMTDMLVFCHPTDRTLFQELVAYRNRGTPMYLVVQE